MIDRELLQQAWPEGFLASRGAFTLGEYVYMGLDCVDAHLWGHIDEWDVVLKKNGDWRTGREETESAKALADGGDLLPNVDSTDVATWACLKADLHQATDQVRGRGASEYTWIRTRDGAWWLGVYTCDEVDQEEGRCFPIRFPHLDTDDPALALVLARIQIREEEGR